jgi:hypothetical protein
MGGHGGSGFVNYDNQAKAFFVFTILLYRNPSRRVFAGALASANPFILMD